MIFTVREVNDSMVDFFVDKIVEQSLKQKIKTVGIVGLAYREGVNSLAYARTIPLIRKLKELGYNVFGFDNNLSEELAKKDLGICISPISKIDECDLILIVNKIDEYASNLKLLKNKIILDPKNLLNKGVD